MQSLVITLAVLLFLQVHAFDLPDASWTPEDYACMSELNIEKKTVETFFSENIEAEVGNSLMDSYSECWNKKMNFLNEEGEFNFDNFHGYIVRELFIQYGKNDIENKEEVAHNAVQQCKEIKGSNPGELSNKIFNCVNKYIRSL
ncbi:hypothetical protein RN001_007022 [Aquatica leii]|uniref:Uncharacterized protein n=1 Tax=Aquatica leii TaxID=1421715 RepID=A0AAN7PEQ6_9COLE|nr:hypothetical protein RN001_007022 [Aquatica leii]